MDVDALKAKTMNFLRKYGHLDSPTAQPSFRDKDFPGYMDAIVIKQPWKRGDPLFCQQAISGDEIYASNYRAAIDNTTSMHEIEFGRVAISDIPDSEEFALVDIGSSMGRRNTRPFAKAKPNVRVFMIDKFDGDEIENPMNYEYAKRTDIAGEELRVRVTPRDNIEDWMNDLMEANGYRNIRFIHSELQYPGSGKTNLGRIAGYLSKRRTVFTGYLNPAGLGNITVLEAAHHGAERVYLNNSALEKLSPDSPRWGLVRDFLSDLPQEETDKIVSLIWDPEHNQRGCGNFKYDTDIDGQRMFSTVLRQVFALAQVQFLQEHGMDVDLYLNTYPYGNPSYNNPSHNIRASRSVE